MVYLVSLMTFSFYRYIGFICNLTTTYSAEKIRKITLVMFILCGPRDKTDSSALPPTYHHLPGRVQGRGKIQDEF